MAATFDLPEAPGPQRDAMLLAHARAGELELVWTPITVSAGGHTATLQVTADAMKLAGVRFGAGAGLAQSIADVVGALLLTPKLLDAMYAARAVTIAPQPLGGSPSMMNSSWFQRHSQKVDAALAAAGYSGGIAQSVGKPWMMTNLLLAHPGRAVNYGWHVPPDKSGASPNPWLGVATMASVTLPKIRVLQDPGWAHGLDQADYSETVQLVHRRCVVDGKDTDTGDLYQDPVLSALVSHEGPLKIIRQPGVPLACAPPGGGGGRVAMPTEGSCPLPPPPARASSSSVPAWPFFAGGALALGGAGLALYLRRRRVHARAERR